MAVRHAFQRGDVVIVQFPFSSGLGIKARPAVVLSTMDYHDQWDELLVVGVTSRQPKSLRLTDCALQNWQQAGLKQPSWARCHLATVHYVRIRQHLGQLTVNDLAALEKCLRIALGL